MPQCGSTRRAVKACCNYFFHASCYEFVLALIALTGCCFYLHVKEQLVQNTIPTPGHPKAFVCKDYFGTFLFIGRTTMSQQAILLLIFHYWSWSIDILYYPIFIMNRQIGLPFHYSNQIRGFVESVLPLKFCFYRFPTLTRPSFQHKGKPSRRSRKRLSLGRVTHPPVLALGFRRGSDP